MAEIFILFISKNYDVNYFYMMGGRKISHFNFCISESDGCDRSMRHDRVCVVIQNKQKEIYDLIVVITLYLIVLYCNI